MWAIMWTFRFPALPNDFLHIGQLCGFSPLWVSMCFASWLGYGNTLVHLAHGDLLDILDQFLPGLGEDWLLMLQKQTKKQPFSFLSVRSLATKATAWVYFVLWFYVLDILWSKVSKFPDGINFGRKLWRKFGKILWFYGAWLKQQAVAPPIYCSHKLTPSITTFSNLLSSKTESIGKGQIFSRLSSIAQLQKIWREKFWKILHGSWIMVVWMYCMDSADFVVCLCVSLINAVSDLSIWKLFIQSLFDCCWEADIENWRAIIYLRDFDAS